MVTPKLDSFNVHKKEYINIIGNPTLTKLKEKESHAHMLNGLVSVSETFKYGWDTYLEFLEKAYPKNFKHIQLG